MDTVWSANAEPGGITVGQLTDALSGLLAGPRPGPELAGAAVRDVLITEPGPLPDFPVTGALLLAVGFQRNELPGLLTEAARR